MKRAFVFQQTFRSTAVVHFNERKLVKENDINGQRALVEHVGAKKREKFKAF